MKEYFKKDRLNFGEILKYVLVNKLKDWFVNLGVMKLNIICKGG